MSKCAVSELEKLLPEEKRRKPSAWFRLRNATEEEYPELVRFFIKNELEYTEEDEEEVDTDIVHSYKMVNDREEMVAAACLAKREGEFIIDGIAVDEEYRKHKLGKILLDKLVARAKEMDGHSIYLVARAPGFFRAYGFETVDPSTAPNFFECKYCDQYGKTCHPEVMKYTF